MKIRTQRLIQLAAAAVLNGYAMGFAEGKIFTGPTKSVCVPVLNCYSCPGALGACPIGALQAAFGSAGRGFPFYVVGTLLLFGILLGRLSCGLLCPFGFIQDLLHRIPVPKLKVPAKIDRPLRWLKYGVLAIMVIGLPAIVAAANGYAPPFFCEFLCPAGTLEAGVPLLAMDERLRSQIGWLFNWKTAILLAIVVLSLFIHRPFCRYLCPLGGLWGLFNRFSLVQLQWAEPTCVHCGKCAKACPMAVDPVKDQASAECIRCTTCVSVCPTNSLHLRTLLRPKASLPKDAGATLETSSAGNPEEQA